MKTRILVIAFAFLPWIASAQVDTIYHLDSKLIKQFLKPSANQYLVFIQRKGDPRMAFTFVWSRE